MRQLLSGLKKPDRLSSSSCVAPRHTTNQRAMSYRAWFQCINEQCGATYPLNSIVYHCRNCGSLLEVRHDLQALAHVNAQGWMKLFEERYKSNQWPYGSGVWGQKEWILPEI